MAALMLSACDDDGGTTAGGKGGTAGQGGEGGNGQGGDGGDGQGGDGGSAQVVCNADPGLLDVGGIWAGRAAMTVGVQGKPGGVVAVCPEEQEGTAELVFVLSIHQNGTGLQDVRATICDASLPPVTAVLGTCSPGATGQVTTEILVPDALRQALAKLPVDPVTGTVSEESAGATFNLARLAFTAGASPMVEELPAWNLEEPACDAGELGRTNVCEAACVSDCASLRDHDDDTFPGVTLDVCGRTPDDEGKMCPAEDPADGVTLQGRAFTVVRIDPLISGIATSSCQMTGTVDANIQYSVIGADMLLGGLPVPVSSTIEALPELLVKTDKSQLMLVRVDGKYGTETLDLDLTDPAAACQTVRDQVNALF